MSTKTKHTPGRGWSCRQTRRKASSLSVMLNDRSVADCEPVGPWMKSQTAHANARLIAAAPELYDALNGWVAHLDSDIDSPTNTPEHEEALMKCARAALARARGET